jgi:hypothetical protein
MQSLKHSPAPRAYHPYQTQTLTNDQPNNVQREVDIQCANGIICIEEGQESSVGNEVVDATLANNLGSVDSGLLQAGVAGKVCVEDMDIGTVAQLRGYLFLGRSFVADQTDDEVLRVFGDLFDELELVWTKQRQCVTRHKPNSPRFPSKLR